MCTIGELKSVLSSTASPVPLVVHEASKLPYVPADAPEDIAKVKSREDAERLHQYVFNVMVSRCVTKSDFNRSAWCSSSIIHSGLD